MACREAGFGAEVATPKAPEKDPSKNNGEPVNADAGWRNDRRSRGLPAHCIARAGKIPAFDGLTVLYSERPGLPLVRLIWFCTPEAGEPVDRPGLASMTARMLQQGTTTRSALQIADRAADLGATRIQARERTRREYRPTHFPEFPGCRWNCWRTWPCIQFSAIRDRAGWGRPSG